MKNTVFLIIISYLFIGCKENKILKNRHFDDISYIKTFDKDKKDQEGFTYFNLGFTEDIHGLENKAALLYSENENYAKSHGFKLSKNFTISFWVKTGDNNENAFTPIITRPLEKYNEAPYYQFLFGIRGSNYSKAPYTFLFWLSIDSKLYTLSSIINWRDEKWYHLAGSYDGEIIRFYVNGKLQAKKYVVGSVNQSNIELFFGKHQNHNFFFTGALDDFQYYQRTLSEKEIRVLANQ